MVIVWIVLAIIVYALIGKFTFAFYMVMFPPRWAGLFIREPEWIDYFPQMIGAYLWPFSWPFVIASLILGLCIMGLIEIYEKLPVIARVWGWSGELGRKLAQVLGVEEPVKHHTDIHLD